MDERKIESFLRHPVEILTKEEEEAYWLSDTIDDDKSKCETYKYVFQASSYMFILVVLLSTYMLLIAYSSNGAENYTFFFTTVTLCGELLKLFMSLCLYMVTRYMDSHSYTPIQLTLKKSAHFAIPSFLYVLNNNLLFLILIMIDPTTFQILAHVGIIFVALFTILLLRRTLDIVQWISMIILFVGTALTQLGCDIVISKSKFMTLLLVLLFSALDALGSVYTERRLKMDVEDSIHVQNIHLFAYSSIANAVLFFIYDFKHVLHSGFFYGYSWVTVIIILAFGVSGIFSNLIMKQQSTIARMFCISISVLLTAGVAYMFLEFKPSLLYVASFIIVLCSLLLYRHEDISNCRFIQHAKYDARITECKVFSELVKEEDL